MITASHILVAVVSMKNDNRVDIRENDILHHDPMLLSNLLRDHSSKKNIIWATDDYSQRGEGFQFASNITVESITGENGNVIQPRVSKDIVEQKFRVREKAEVFTPAWICNKQNNLIDMAWFGRKRIFNTETESGWKPIQRPISFPKKKGKSWQDYVRDVRLEIACGEAPYLASRYDAITGLPIDIKARIGLLDRKLRVVSENTASQEEWIAWATVAFQSIYGFEWQGDNLLLARESLLFTFIDYYKDKFSVEPSVETLREIAIIISWNLWQMDGLKGVVPNSCNNCTGQWRNIFGEMEEVPFQICRGCDKNDIRAHNGIYCIIKDWQTGKTLKFTSLLK